MSRKKDDPEHVKLAKELEGMLETIRTKQKAIEDATLESVCAEVPTLPRPKLHTRVHLRGHLDKVNDVHFSGDARHCVSGSLDGKLIIWDAWTGNKTQIIPLKSSWVMMCVFAPSGNYLASGGMDNVCTIHDVLRLDEKGVAKIIREIPAFEGMLSCGRFVDDSMLVVGSGDHRVSVWDVDKGKQKTEFFGHEGDITAISIIPKDRNTCLSASADKTAKIWDLRMGGATACAQTFFGHESDVNGAEYYPTAEGVVTSSDDKTAKLFDRRSDHELATYKTQSAASSLTRCALSVSGRILFVGSDDSSVHMWDTLKCQYLGNLCAHESKITGLSMTSNGVALATSSWDHSVRIWG